MNPWEIIFFPAPGERNCPQDYISAQPAAERAQITHRLKTIRQLEKAQWPPGWVHYLTREIGQLTAGPHRIMFCLDGRRIVIIHAYRKVRQKTAKVDLERAQNHRDWYLEQKEGPPK